MRRGMGVVAAVGLMLISAAMGGLAMEMPDLPKMMAADAKGVGADWLVTPTKRKTGVFRVNDKEIAMTNGLIRRTWRIAPNGATVGFDNLTTGESLLRGVKPEARVVLDGKAIEVGGLKGQPDYAYLKPEWLDSMRADEGAWKCVGFEVGKIAERFAWKRKRWSSAEVWPPKGISLTFRYAAPVGGGLEGVVVGVHYEMYDGIPLLAKWITVTNGTGKAVRLGAFTSEILAVVEAESEVENPGVWRPESLRVETDYSFVGMEPKIPNRPVQWIPDPDYATQVNYARLTPCLLECRPPLGPDVDIAPGETFESFRTFELAMDSTDRERQGLAARRMYRTIAPWATENPILMHVRQANPKAVKLAIDQCAAVGFEMVIMSFGSGFDIENEDPKYLAQVKELADYAHGKGVEIGGYSLLASRRIDDANDAINPKTGKPGGMIFGNSPCLCSKWGEEYFRKLYSFIEKTGIDVLEHDGSYPGDTCASTSHPGHRGLDDSQWRQWKKITDFYKWCRGRGVYLNVPDWYYLTGSTKSAMGYRETNWSLPRERQVILARQNIYDGTWGKTPSMGWMFVPLVEYQGGGAAATLEPLKDHLADYERHLMQNFAAGVQACYRGPRLYDSEATKAVAKRWADFYKAHRAILDSDVIHVRRPDGRDYDCLMHVNPNLPTKGLAFVYNPLDRPLKFALTLPLYYTGLTKTAKVRIGGGKARSFALDREFRIRVPVEIPARGYAWLTVQ